MWLILLLVFYNRVFKLFCADQSPLQISVQRKQSPITLGQWILFLTCPVGKLSFTRNSNYRRTVKSILPIKMFLGLVEMTFGLVYASFSLPKWQALKVTFYAPCRSTKRTMKFNLLREFCEPCSYTCQLSRLRVENFDLMPAHACGPISHA